MENPKDSNGLRTAYLILILQVIAWAIAITPFFEDYSSSNDAAGAGMAHGFAILFITLPGMVFIFLSSLYFLFKKGLPKWFKFIAAFYYVGLFALFSAVNW